MSKANLPDWDWVTARAACEPSEVYAKLRQLTERDVATRNRQLGKERFQLQDFADQDTFAVTVSGNHPRRTMVLVRLKPDGEFAVRNGPSDPHLTARVELTLTEGREECMLRTADDALLSPWQFLKRALEPFLFGQQDDRFF